MFYFMVNDLVFIITVGRTVAGANHAPPARTAQRDCKAVAAAVARFAAKR